MTRTIPFLCGKNPAREVSGGHSAYVRAHARAAIAAGYTPHFHCVGPENRTVETDFGVVHQAASIPPWRQLGLPWHARVLAASVRRRHREGFPVVHGFALWSWVGIRLAREGRARGVPVRTIASLYTSHLEESRSQVRWLVRESASRAKRIWYRAQDAWSRRVLAHYERAVVRESDRVLVNYDRVRALLESAHGPIPRCVKISYTAGSETAAAPAPSAGNRPLVVAISRHEPRKGVGVLIEALARLRKAGLPFRARLIGDGILLPEHARLVRRLGIADAVEIAGGVPDAPGELRGADVFALPSLEEQSGSMALLEAVRAGVAAVVSGVDGLLEDVADGQSALVVPPGNPEALAGALARLIRDGELRRRLGENGRALYRRRFSIEALTETLRGLYEELDG